MLLGGGGGGDRLQVAGPRRDRSGRVCTGACVPPSGWTAVRPAAPARLPAAESTFQEWTRLFSEKQNAAGSSPTAVSGVRCRPGRPPVGARGWWWGGHPGGTGRGPTRGPGSRSTRRVSWRIYPESQGDGHTGTRDGPPPAKRGKSGNHVREQAGPRRDLRTHVHSRVTPTAARGAAVSTDGGDGQTRGPCAFTRGRGARTGAWAELTQDHPVGPTQRGSPEE